MLAPGWMVPILGAVVLLDVAAVILIVRYWPKKSKLSHEDQMEMANAPMPIMQTRAWWGLGIGVAAFCVIAVILTTKGAMTYWVDDDLRLLVVGIFLAGLLGSFGATNLPLIQQPARQQLDERDRAVLARAPTAQMALVVLGVAAWVISLTQLFHDEGAVPVVYLYLMFGSVILFMMIGQSLGILLGYWSGARNGEG